MNLPEYTISDFQKPFDAGVTLKYSHSHNEWKIVKVTKGGKAGTVSTTIKKV